MEEGASSSLLLHLQSGEESYDIHKCIICQRDNKKKCGGTANGRIKIIEAAQIREDHVWEYLQSPSINQNFVYHVSNECYKTYTLVQTLTRLKQVGYIKIYAKETYSLLNLSLYNLLLWAMANLKKLCQNSL